MHAEHLVLRKTRLLQRQRIDGDDFAARIEHCGQYDHVAHRILNPVVD